MTPLLTQLRRNDVRAFFACWLLLAYMCRAFIPLGYMPELRTAEQGFHLSLCQGEAPFVDGQEDEGHKDRARHKIVSCLYGFNAVAVFAPPVAVLAVSPVFAALLRGFLPFMIAPDDRRYGNASPRSPPR